MAAWRSREEELERLGAEQSAVAAKRQQHDDAYRKERAELAHLSWRQRKAQLYRNNKSAFASRPGEKTAPAGAALPLIIKGTTPRLCSAKAAARRRRDLFVFVCVCARVPAGQPTWTAPWRPS